MRKEPTWEQLGFGRQPYSVISRLGQQVARAFSPVPSTRGSSSGEFFGSRLYSDCCFVFADVPEGRVDRNRLMEFGVVRLERNLNAALWNNDYNSLQIFDVALGTKILIGPVGHYIRTWDDGYEKEPGDGFDKRSVLPLFELYQARIVGDRDIETVLTKADFPWNPLGWQAFSGKRSSYNN